MIKVHLVSVVRELPRCVDIDCGMHVRRARESFVEVSIWNSDFLGFLSCCGAPSPFAYGFADGFAVVEEPK